MAQPSVRTSVETHFLTFETKGGPLGSLLCLQIEHTSAAHDKKEQKKLMGGFYLSSDMHRTDPGGSRTADGIPGRFFSTDFLGGS